MPGPTHKSDEWCPTIKVSTYVDHAVLARLALVADEEGLSVADIVSRAILRDLGRADVEAGVADHSDETARLRERQLAWMLHVNRLWHLLPQPARAIAWLAPAWLAQALHLAAW